MADRYWRGGSGTWNATNTANWSATSGGAGGASVPTASDAVIVDASSGSPVITVAVSTRPCLSLTTTGATCTIAGTVGITVSGSITLSSTTTWSNTGVLTIAAISTITTNGVTINSSISSAFSVTLGSALTLDTTRTFTFTAGTLTLSNFMLSTGLFSSTGIGGRTFAFGTGNITTTGSGAVFSVSAITLGYTGTPTVNISNNSATATSLALSNFTITNAFNFNVTVGTYILTLGTTAIFRSLNFTGFSGTWSATVGNYTFFGDVLLSSTMTNTPGTAVWTFANTSGVATLTSANKTVGPIALNGSGGTLRLGDTFSQTTNRAFTYTAGTIDINSQTNTFGVLTITAYPTIINGTLNASAAAQSSGTVTIPVSQTFTVSGAYTFTGGTLDVGTNTVTLSVGSFVSTSGTRVITFGTGNITTINSGTAFNVVGTNLTYTGTPTVNISNNSATATTVTATSFTTTNALNFNITTGTYAFTLSASSQLRSLNFTGFTGSWSPGGNGAAFYGDVTLVSGMTYTAGTGSWFFSLASGTQTITSAGKTLGPITQDNVSGTLTLNGALTTLATSQYTFTNGTLNLAGFTLSVGAFFSVNTNTRVINFGTSNITITGNASGSPLSVTASGLTYTGTPTVNISYSGASALSIDTTTGNGFSATNAFDINATTGTYALTLVSGSVFKSLNFTGFTGSWSPSTNTATFYGSVTLVAGMTFTTGTGVFTFANTSGTAVLTSGGKTVGPITLNASGGTLQLGSTFSQTTTAAFTYTAGTIDINSQTNTFGALTITTMPTITNGPLNATTVTQSSGTVTVPASAIAKFTATGLYTLTSGTLDLGTNNATLSVGAVTIGSNTVTFGTSGQLTLTGNSTTVYTALQPTFTGTTKIVSNYSGSTGTRTFTMGSMTEANVIDVSAGTVTGLSFGTAGTDVVSIAGNMKSLDLTGFTGTFANQTRTLYGNLTTPSTGGTYSAGALITALAATSGTQTITSNARTFDFTIRQNGAGGTVVLSGALTLETTRAYQYDNGTLNLSNNSLTTGSFTSSTGNTRVLQFGTGNITVTGSGSTAFFVTGSTLTYTGTPTVNISNNSATATTVTATTGFTETKAFNFNITTGTYALTIATGSFFKSLNFTGFTGTWAPTTQTSTFYGNLTLVAGMTFTAGTGVWTFANTSGTATLTSAGKTLYAITESGAGGILAFSDATTLSNALTFTDGTLQLPASLTTTVGSFVTTGTTLKFLTSSIPGTQATISDPSGTNAVTYLSIQDSNATGGALFDASGVGNVNAGNNTGWFGNIFGGGNYFLLF